MRVDLYYKLLRHLLDNTCKAFTRFSLTSMRYQYIPENRKLIHCIFLDQLFPTDSYTVFKASSAAEGHLDQREGRIEATYWRHRVQN